MPPPFHTGSMALRELLGGDLTLAVPSYQRSFSWTAEQAGQLLDDLLTTLDEAGDEEADYFLGALVLMEVNAAEGAEHPSGKTYEIVDGLQRLITLTILFAVLRDVVQDDDPLVAAWATQCVEATVDKSRFRLELPGEEQAFFRAFVQQPRATYAMPEDDDLLPAEGRLLAVREHLIATVIDESPERRRRLVQLLRNGCHCAVIITSSLDRAYRIFTVINDRGLKLARGDILKAQLLGSIPADRRDLVSIQWRQLEGQLGGSLDELLSHVRTIEGRGKARIIDEIRALVVRSGDAETFVAETLLPYGTTLVELRQATLPGSRLPQSLSAAVRHLDWLGSQDWMPPLMLFWRMVDGDVDAVEGFLQRLDRLAYGMKLLGVGQDKRSIRYRALIEAIRTGTLDRPGGGPLDLTRDELRLINYNLRALHSRSQMACKLVLLRLNDILAGGSQDLDPASLTVEHVLPQKPGRNSKWREWFPNGEERERCTQSLGNLILVPRRKNEEARNLDLDRKMAIYFADASEMPAVTREIQGIAEWRADDVMRREEHLVQVLEQLWQLGSAKPQPDDPGSARDGKRLATRSVRLRTPKQAASGS